MCVKEWSGHAGFADLLRKVRPSPEKGVPLPSHGTLLSEVLKILEAASERYFATSPTPLLMMRDRRAAVLCNMPLLTSAALIPYTRQGRTCPTESTFR